MMAERYGDLTEEEAIKYAAECFINKRAMALGLASCKTDCKVVAESPPGCSQVNRDQVFARRGKGILFPPNQFVQENLHNTAVPEKPPPEERVAVDPQWEEPIKRRLF